MTLWFFFRSLLYVRWNFPGVGILFLAWTVFPYMFEEGIEGKSDSPRFHRSLQSSFVTRQKGKKVFFLALACGKCTFGGTKKTLLDFTFSKKIASAPDSCFFFPWPTFFWKKNVSAAADDFLRGKANEVAAPKSDANILSSSSFLFLSLLGMEVAEDCHIKSVRRKKKCSGR